MKIINHGHWKHYTPTERPEGFPPDLPLQGILFAKRESDGTDWYAFHKTLPPETIKMTVMKFDPAPWRIQAVVRDADMLFPVDALVLEVEGLEGKPAQLFEEYSQREFNPQTNKIGEKPMPPSAMAVTIADSAQSLQLATAKALAAEGRTDEALATLIAVMESQT
jgi:hypothetical protein